MHLLMLYTGFVVLLSMKRVCCDRSPVAPDEPTSSLVHILAPGACSPPHEQEGTEADVALVVSRREDELAEESGGLLCQTSR